MCKDCHCPRTAGYRNKSARNLKGPVHEVPQWWPKAKLWPTPLWVFFFFFQIIIWAHFLTTETHILGRTGSSPSFFHQPLQTRVFPSSGSVTSRLWLNWSWAQDIRALSINSTNRRTPVVPSDLGQIQFILSSLLWFSWWEEKAKVCYVQVCLFWPLEQSQKELFQQNSLCP